MAATKVLVAGSFKYEVYDESIAKALEKLGCAVTRFGWQHYYGKGLLNKFQQRYLYGPGIWRLNRDIVIAARSKPFDLIFITRGVPLWPKTIEYLCSNGHTKVMSYNNDDPCGADKGRSLWRNFINSIPYYDWHFVFRKVNIEEYEKLGAKRVSVLMPYYVPELHFPIVLTHDQAQLYGTDLVFVGNATLHDKRFLMLEPLISAGYKVRFYGNGWENISKHYPWLKGHSYPPVWGITYTSAIRGSKVALAVYSRTNRDTYSTRSFEIPAIGTCLLSERTQDMLAMYRENCDAVYFDNPDELLASANRLLRDDELREQIANRALERVRHLHGSVLDRGSDILHTLSLLQCKNSV